MTKRKKVLVYSSFPPQVCGIGAYAAEHVLYLKSLDQSVYTCTLDDVSVGHYRVNLYSMKSIVKLFLIILLSRYDGIHVHYTADFFYPFLHAGPRKKAMYRLLQSLLFITIGLRSGKEGSIIFHEAYPGSSVNPTFLKLKGVAFSLFRRMEFHTESERTRILEAFPRFLKPERAHVVAHERYMRRKYMGDQAMARQYLNLHADKKIFLCIGFIQDHKAFHLAVEAFRQAAVWQEEAVLYIVGSLRVINKENLAYRTVLTNAISGVPNVVLVEQFVSDEDFDRWIVAADAVILPYHEISSSGVGARTALYGRDLFINAKTNLKAQFQDYPHTFPFQGVDELTTLMKQYVSSHKGSNKQREQRGGEQAQKQKPILFIAPTYGRRHGTGEDEILAIGAALKKHGQAAELWTTGSGPAVQRASEFFRVRRFVRMPFAGLLWRPLHRWMSAPGPVNWAVESAWRCLAPYGLGMKSALRRQHEHFSTIHLWDYRSGASHRLAGLFPSKTILHPQFKDEPLLYRRVMRRLFAGVRGVICESRGERMLGERVSLGLLGSCYKCIGRDVVIDTAALSHPVADHYHRRRELLYIGPVNEDAGVDRLVKWLKKYNKGKEKAHQIRLTLFDTGPARYKLYDPGADVYYGALPDAETLKPHLAESLALVCPSRYDNNSEVIQQAWTYEMPVLVHRDAVINRTLVGDGGGGMVVGSAKEFGETLDLLLHDKFLYWQMGLAGRDFVRHLASSEGAGERFLSARASLMDWDNQYEDWGGTKSLMRVGSLRQLPNAKGHTLVALDQLVLRHPPTEAQKSFQRLLGNEFYKAFEEDFRDPSGKAKIFPSWPDYLAVAKTLAEGESWLDIGAGRGDFLGFLRDNGIKNHNLFGVEPDPASYFQMKKAGFHGCSMLADEFLDLAGDSSVSVISMLHVVEHIPWDALCCIAKMAYHKLRTGGTIILELPYANTLKTSGTNFWLDPTHIRPVVADTLEFLLRFVGFTEVQRKTYAPHFPPDEMTRLSEAVGSPLLVREIYGDQDVSIIGKKR